MRELEVLVDALLERVPRSAALLFADGEKVDGTHSHLRSWAARNARLRAILVPHSSELPGRLARLALCRNTLLGEALGRLPAANGLLLTLDLDCRPEVGAIVTTLAGATSSSAWDLLTANSEPYRDTWALRSRRLGIDYDCWQDQPTMRERGECRRYRISIDPGAPPFDVRSAFNGLSVLRVASLYARNATGCRYPDSPAGDPHDPSIGVVEAAGAHPDAGVGKGGVVCEHVVFNDCLRQHGLRIGIYPALMSNCPCGAICGSAQRYWFRLQVFRNGTLTIHDRRRRRPASAKLWRGVAHRVCGERPVVGGALGPQVGGNGSWERRIVC